MTQKSEEEKNSRLRDEDFSCSLDVPNKWLRDK
jgi:hypothetical protein